MKIQVKDLKKKFGSKEVLKGISLEAESGQALGLLGRNGAGKTTTIRIIMGVFFQDSGSILIDDKPIERDKLQIGYLPEERGLYPKNDPTPVLYLLIARDKSRITAMIDIKFSTQPVIFLITFTIFCKLLKDYIIEIINNQNKS